MGEFDKNMEKVDKRKETSRANIKKAQEVRKKQYEEKKNVQYPTSESETETSESETEIIYVQPPEKKQKKSIKSSEPIDIPKQDVNVEKPKRKTKRKIYYYNEEVSDSENETNMEIKPEKTEQVKEPEKPEHKYRTRIFG